MLPPQRATSRCRNHNSEGEHYVKLYTFFLVTSALLGKHLHLTVPFLHMCLITPLPFSAPAGKISVLCNHLNQLNQKKKNSHGNKTQNVFVPVFFFKDLSGAFFFCITSWCYARLVCLKSKKEKRRMRPCYNRGRDDIKELMAEEQTPRAAVFAFHIERSGNRTRSSLKD